MVDGVIILFLLKFHGSWQWLHTINTLNSNKNAGNMSVEWIKTDLWLRILVWKYLLEMLSFNSLLKQVILAWSFLREKLIYFSYDPEELNIYRLSGLNLHSAAANQCWYFCNLMIEFERPETRQETRHVPR